MVPQGTAVHTGAVYRETKLEGVWQARWGGHDGPKFLCAFNRCGERERLSERAKAEIFMINDFTGQCRASSALSPWGVSGPSHCARRSKLTGPRWVISEYYLNVNTHTHTYSICYIYCIVHTLLQWYRFGLHWHGHWWQTCLNAIWFLLCLSYVHIDIITSQKYQRKMQLISNG